MYWFTHYNLFAHVSAYWNNFTCSNIKGVSNIKYMSTPVTINTSHANLLGVAIRWAFLCTATCYIYILCCVLDVVNYLTQLLGRVMLTSCCCHGVLSRRYVWRPWSYMVTYNTPIDNFERRPCHYHGNKVLCNKKTRLGDISYHTVAKSAFISTLFVLEYILITRLISAVNLACVNHIRFFL